MANLCSTSGWPAGLSTCEFFIQKVKGFYFLQPGESIPVNLLSIASKFVEFLQVDPIKAFYLKVESYENTSDEPEVQTSGSGTKVVTQEFNPSATFFSNLNPCNYAHLLGTMKNRAMDVIPIYADGTYMATVVGDQAFGFSALVTASTPGLPIPDNIFGFYRFYLSFTNLAQFTNAPVTRPDGWLPLLDLPLAVPNGLSMQLISYDGADAEVIVTERCGDAMVGLVLADFEIVDQNATTTITAVTDNGEGSYTVSIALAADEWATIRVIRIDTGIVTDISGNITLFV